MILRIRFCFALSLVPLFAVAAVFASPSVFAQQQESNSKQSAASGSREFQGQTSQDYNRRLKQLSQDLAQPPNSADDYRIGTEDLLEISVFEAPDLDRTVRVSAGGQIALPMIGEVTAAGLTARELESVLRERLQHTIMKDPHVSVFVKEMESHAVSVFGAVKKPGVYQIREPESLVEILSLAEGLADDAGDSVIVMRAADPPADARGATNSSADASSVTVNLKHLLQSGDPRYNVEVFPGDIVKVPEAGIVYVVGEVKKPGGFLLKSNENISVLQALALAEGLTRTSSKGHARIIHTNSATGKRTEIPIDLGKVLSGKAPDLELQANDIVFVPNSTGKSAFFKGAEDAISIAGGVIIYRR